MSTSLPAGTIHSDDPSPGCSAWTLVVKGKSRRSLPLYVSQDDSTELELSNFFAPLAALPTSPAPLLSGGCAEVNLKAGGASKRLRSSGSDTSTGAVSSSVKRPPVCTSSPEGSDGAPAPTSRAPATTAGLRSQPCHGPSKQVAAPLNLQSTTSADVNPASLANAACQLPPKLAVYSAVSSNPEILIVGDSIVRYLTLPCAITSGGKVVDLIEIIPTLIDLHPTVNIVLAHIGTNDIMAINSSKLHADLESLCYTIESLGKCCLLSGPIPTLSKTLSDLVVFSVSITG